MNVVGVYCVVMSLTYTFYPIMHQLTHSTGFCLFAGTAQPEFSPPMCLCNFRESLWIVLSSSSSFSVIYAGPAFHHLMAFSTT